MSNETVENGTDAANVADNTVVVNGGETKQVKFSWMQVANAVYPPKMAQHP
jgi:hypothetical protein